MSTSLQYELTPEDIAYCDAVVCAGFHAIKYHTLQVVEQILSEDISGDFAECGVLYGAHPAIMMRSLMRRGIRNRKVHLFDSFQGIPRATEEDTEAEIGVYGLKREGRMESTGVSCSSVENTLDNLKKWGAYDASLIEVHPGWFEETLARDAASVGSLALLRVDVDLYDSTRAVYGALWDKVVLGGFVIDDDYGPHEVVKPCRRAMESICGPQLAIAVDGQTTTSWWRKA